MNSIPRLVAGLTAAVLVAAGLVVGTATAPAARADTIELESWQDVTARFSTHVGYDGASPDGVPRLRTIDRQKYGTAPDGTVAGTITNPGGTPGLAGGATSFVSPGTTAWTAHGTGASTTSTSLLDLSEQSALGFEPRSLGASIETGVLFNLGRVIHINNVVSSGGNDWFQGNLQLAFLDTAFVYRWQLYESPNVCQEGQPEPCNVDDVVNFTTDTTGAYVYANDRVYALVITGFTAPQGAGGTCDQTTDAGDVVSEFITQEATTNYSCLYASLEPVHVLSITKAVDSPYSAEHPSPSFGFSSTSTVAGSLWDGAQFALADGEQMYLDLLGGEQVTVTEVSSDPSWELSGVACVDGAGAPVDGVGVNGSTLTVPAGLDIDVISCTYTNTYVPQSTLTLQKVVEAGDDPDPAVPGDFTLRAEGQGAVAGTVVSGTGGSAEVAARTVISGTYALSEAAGDAVTAAGYEQSGPWTCVEAGGGPVAVDDGAVALDAGADVTCTVTNVYTTGSLAITKTVGTVPAGGYTKGDGVAFQAGYDCAPAGPSGTVTVYPGATNGGAGVPAVVTDIPVGSVCTVTEVSAPTGSTDLVDGSWSWVAPVVPAPVAILAGAMNAANITNVASQGVGTLVIGVAVEPRAGTDPAGETGGPGREFPIGYVCTIGDTVVASGTVQVTRVAPVSVDVPLTAVCRITDAAFSRAAGDFVGDAFAWDGYDHSDAVTISAGTPASLQVTGYFVETVATLPTAVPSAPPAATSAASPPSSSPSSSSATPAALASTGASPLPVGVIGLLLLALGAVVAVVRTSARRRMPVRRR